MIETAAFCSRCGLSLRRRAHAVDSPRPVTPGSLAQRPAPDNPPRRWYQIGHLDADRAIWADALLIVLGFAAWLMSSNNPDPRTAAGAGTLCGAVVGTFGFCGAIGWIASSAAWRICRKLQTPTLIGFVIGAAGVFSLVALGSARIDRRQTRNVAQPTISVPAGYRDLGPVPSNIPAPPPGFALESPTAPEQQTRSNPVVDLNDPFAATPGMVPAFQTPPQLQAPPPTNVDLPAAEVRKLNAVARKDDADVVIEAIEPDAWVLSALVVQFTPVGNPAKVGMPKTFLAPRYIPLAGEHGKAHFFIKDALLVDPGKQEAWVNWRVIGAKGHRSENHADPESDLHARVVDAVSQLRVQAIITTRPMACRINNSVYQKGQQIGSLTVEDITPHSVIVRGGKYRFELTMAR